MEALFVTADQEKETETSQKCSYAYCLPFGYNKMEAPFKDLEPLEIDIQVDVLQIHEIDDIAFTVSLSLNLIVSWRDFRITGPTPDDPQEIIPIDVRFVQNLWLPDFYIYDMKEIVPKKFNIPFAGNTLNLLFLNLVIQFL